jgi:hypothetical protein
MKKMQLAPSSLAQWVGAIATTAAVMTALFKDEVIRYLRRPKLTVRITPEPPDCLLSPITVSGGGGLVWSGNSYWLRLWVGNPGNARAEQVQVFVSKLFRRGANREFSPIADFVPMNLRWSNSRDPRNPEIFAPGISRGMGKHCDLCSISDPSNPTDVLDGYRGQCVATLQLEVYPSANRHRLPPGDYVIELTVGAANAEPVSVYLGLNLTGKWSSDLSEMFRENIGVKMVARP